MKERRSIMNEYTTPILEITVFETEDVITTSTKVIASDNELPFVKG